MRKAGKIIKGGIALVGIAVIIGGISTFLNKYTSGLNFVVYLGILGIVGVGCGILMKKLLDIRLVIIIIYICIMVNALERYRLSFIEYIGIIGGGGIALGIITRLILKKSFYKNIGKKRVSKMFTMFNFIYKHK
jgi:hypothetical protein